MKRKKDAKKIEWWDQISEKDLDNLLEEPSQLDEEPSDDIGEKWQNKLWALKEYVYKHPGLTRFELSRECDIEKEFEFKKAISFLKFNQDIYEDEEGFFYSRSRYSMHK